MDSMETLLAHDECAGVIEENAIRLAIAILENLDSNLDLLPIQIDRFGFQTVVQ